MLAALLARDSHARPPPLREQWLTELSTSQLRDLLTLRHNEMEEGA